MTDKQKIAQAIVNFNNAAVQLTMTWAEVESLNRDFLGTEDYPKCLPSFDEFTLQVEKWTETQIKILLED